jgi:hypothetical protein
MRRLGLGLLGLVFWIAWGTVALADYTWATYGGHQYTLTQNYGTWQESENEAIAAGGYLATISDAAENAFLTDFIKDVSCRDYPYYPPSGNAAWIGLELTGPNKDDSSSWSWASGEPVTYFNLYSPPPVGYNGVHMYLLGANHEVHVGTWCNNPEHETTYNLNMLGIIEVAVPEPSTFILLGAGAIGLLAFVWRRRAG